MEKKNGLLDPKLDVVFQALFGEQGSEKITKAFLENILEIKINEIELNQNPMLRREKIKDKLGVLDVIAKVNNNQNCDIEMQIAKQDYIKDRILYYWSKLYARTIKKGEDYDELEKSIVILISNKKIEGLEELECHTQWKIIETKSRKKILTDKLEIHIIELEKMSENSKSVREGLMDWLMFLQNPNSEGVKSKMEENKELREAKEKLEQISNDGQMQQLAWWREKWVIEENGRKKREKRIKEGQKRIEEGEKRIEEGEKRIEEGEKRIEEGEKRIEEGEKRIEEGEKRIEEGEKKLEDRKRKLEEGQKELEEGQKELEEGQKKLKEEKRDFAKKMLAQKIDIETIVEITGLTKEEIL